MWTSNGLSKKLIDLLEKVKDRTTHLKMGELINRPKITSVDWSACAAADPEL